MLLFNSIAAILEGICFSSLLVGFSFLDASDQSKHWIDSYVRDFIGQISNHQIFVLFMITAIVLQIIRSIIAYCGQIAASKLSINMQICTQKRVYENIFSAPYAKNSQIKMGELLDYTSSPSNLFSQAMDAINRVLVSLFMILGYIVFMSFISLPLTLSIFALFACVWQLQKIFFKRVITASEKHAHQKVHLESETTQYLEGWKDINLFHRHQWILQTISTSLDAIAKTTFKLNLWRHVVLPFNEIISIVLVGVAVILGLYFLQDLQFSLVATLLTFMTLTYRFGTRLQIMTTASAEVAANMGPLIRLDLFLSQRASTTRDAEQGICPKNWQRISFNSLNFSYPNQKTPCIKDISFKISRGNSIAIVGHSGVGKSTLLHLLLGLYDAPKKSILLDELDRSSYKLSSYKQLFAMVSQNVFLFNKTIEENIRFGKPNATLDEIIEVCKDASAHDFIMKLPNGYQTQIGERGYLLSGGERQRLALARALIKESDILILDEATSQVDSETEQFIQQTIEHLKKKKTIVLVAHRLSTVVAADEIIVMDKGTIVERGTHESLLAKKMHYHNFWNLQSL